MTRPSPFGEGSAWVAESVMQVGYKLMAESYGPHELVDQAVRAEQVGFDFVEISDHFHPWFEAQGHSPFAWSVLAAIAAQTQTIGLATGVTCPTIRYHPAIIAQAAATMAILSGGRFTLGIGAGERLNEHVVGNGFPAAHIRHQMLREALEIIHLLWSGGYHSYQGKHLSIEDARVFDLPESPPDVAVAAGGPEAARIAGELGNALFATEPREDLVKRYRAAGGDGPRFAEVSLAWAESEQEAVDEALRTSAWALTGWKVMSELPNPVNFEAAAKTVDADDIRGRFAVGPEVGAHVDAVRSYLDAGYDHIVLQNAGPDPEGFLDFFERELAGALQSLQPSR